MKNGFSLGLIFLCALVFAVRAQDKGKAYELYQAKRFAEAAAQFEAYLATNPDDPAAMIDYASLLSELNRHDDAIKVLQAVRAKTPQNETAAFRLGVEYAALKRFADADRIFTELAKSANPAIASAAADGSRRAKADEKKDQQFKAQQRVYDLANQFRYQEVIDAVTAMEKEGPPPFGMRMQRLYALQSLRQYPMALEGAERLAVDYPKEPGLMLLRAYLLAQLGRNPEADVLWREVKQQNPGTAAAAAAEQRLVKPKEISAEDRVYELARQRKHREVIRAVDEMEQHGPLPLAMQMQRLYSYQALGDNKGALAQLEKIPATHSNATDLAFFRTDLLVREHRWKEASQLLKQIRDEHGETKVAIEAERRLDALPPITNLDKNFWGEAYLSGDYLGRFGTVIGSGFIRQGAFIPNARWLQPYAEMRFGVDTKSGISAERTIITDNHVGLYAGIRAQLLTTEYLFVYAQGGGDIDLLDRRHNGDLSYDYQAGIYGFKSWGPGTIFHKAPKAWKPPEDRPDPFSPETPWKEKKLTGLFFWRGDWFIDAGADFSYYHRYASWIGYAQAHEGFRIFQYGPNLAFDAYVVENFSWDVKGNYFDNVAEIGPGTRFIWLPYKRWEVVLRGEWLNGYYFGRGRDAYAVKPRSHYGEFRAALSLGVRW